MFFNESNIAINLKKISSNKKERSSQINNNIAKAKIHKLELNVENNTASMIVDDCLDSFVTFPLENYNGGYISLVSNGTPRERGAYKSLKIISEDYELLIDFETIKSTDDLYEYFDCFYLKDLRISDIAINKPINECWRINERRHLSKVIDAVDCLQDFGNFAILTLKKRSFTNFKIILEYEQSWVRYGISFGTEIGQFPYILNQYGLCKSKKGSLAYIEAEGYRTIRGGLDQSQIPAANNIKRYIDINSNMSTNYYSRFMDINSSVIRSYSHHSLIFFIKSNESAYKINNKIYPISDNTIVYLPAGSEELIFKYGSKSINVRFELFNERNLEFCTITPKNPEEYQNEFNQLFNIWTQQESGYKYKCTALFYTILANIQSECQISHQKEIPKVIKPAFNYISDNYNDHNITISLCANMCEISEVYFRKIFQEYFGVSPKKYINDLRIKLAISLINSHTYSISEISEKVGFYNPKYFSTIFKKATGLSPSEYKEGIL